MPVIILEYNKEVFESVFLPLKGLTIFSDNSVAERINRELAVEIIAARTPVIRKYC